jgi:hypothetical protein
VFTRTLQRSLSSPYYQIPALLSSILKLCTHLCGVSFLLAVTLIYYMRSSSSLFMSHALAISSSLTWSFLFYLATSISNKIPYYAVFSNLLTLHPSSVQIFSSAPYSQRSSVYTLLWMSETNLHPYKTTSKISSGNDKRRHIKTFFRLLSVSSY